MGRRFLYSAIVFFVCSALPIGGTMLSIALFFNAEYTAYVVNHFDDIIAALFVVTITLIGGVFYLSTDERADRLSQGPT
jgi:DMSO reductase anchor subunit